MEGRIRSVLKVILNVRCGEQAPVPHRGKSAHPGHITYIAAQIAKVKNVEVGEVAAAARRNTKRVYGF
jgi:TatD DNase family protein